MTSEHVQNPFVRIRNQLGRSCAEFAILLNTTPTTVRNYENGLLNAPGKRVLTALRDLGEDPDRITREYIEWRQRRRMELLA